MKDDFNKSIVDADENGKAESEIKEENKNKKADIVVNNDKAKANEVVINVIEDEPYEDLSAFYNVEDIGILDSEEEIEAPKPKKAGKIVAAILGVLLLVAAGAGVYFGFIKDKNTYYTLYEKDQVYSNGVIEVEFEQLNVLDSLLTYELDEDYVYVALVYNFKNVSSETLDWTSTPYMSMKPYTFIEEKGYLPMEADSEEALALLALLSDEVKSEIQSDDSSDVVSGDDGAQSSADSAGPDTSGSADNATSDGSTESDPDAEPEIVELENNVLYGNFDFGALQIFALDYGIDFSTVKDELAPGEERQSADIFKIRKELFDNNIFYIGADNLEAIFKIDLTPVDTLNLNKSNDAQTDTAQ